MPYTTKLPLARPFFTVPNEELHLAPEVLPARGDTRSCQDQGRSGRGRSRSVQGSAMAGAWLSCVFEGELEEMKREKLGV